MMAFSTDVEHGHFRISGWRYRGQTGCWLLSLASSWHRFLEARRIQHCVRPHHCHHAAEFAL